MALVSISHVARVELALALSDLGDTVAAVARLDALAAETHDNPLLHGITHKARAQVALSSGDREAFRAHLQAMQGWFRKTDNAALFAQCQRLAEERRALDPGARALGGSPGSPSAEREHVSIERAFRACRGADERFQIALDLVVEASGAAELRCARAGAPFRSVLLTVSRGYEVVIVGAVALVEGTEPLQPVHVSRLEEIARCIYEAGDVRTVDQHDPRPSAIPPAETRLV